MTQRQSEPPGRPPLGGLAGWLLARLKNARRQQPRLALVERIAVAPRQSVALVEAEGRRFLVATSADGGSAFYPLDHLELDQAGRLRPRAGRTAMQSSRVSW
jgi:flagellar biogenesis protein FliO